MFEKSYIYLLHDGYFRYKIGITENMPQRLREIRRSMPKHHIRKVLALRVYGARVFEGYLHLFYAILRCPHRRGSGKTEWFWFVFPFTPILQMTIYYLIQRFFLFFVSVTAVVLFLYFMKG